MNDPEASASPRLHVISLTHCPICGGNHLEPLGFHYHYAGEDFPAVECGDCGMRFLQRRPDDESLASLYGGEYFADDYRCGHGPGDYFASEEQLRAENDALLNGFERWTAVGSLLEVGCAGGWLLKCARERGWRAKGVEVSSLAVEHARKLGLDVSQGELIEAGLPAEEFDLAYLGDVLEHVSDCKRTLQEAARVLKPGGILYLRGPITTNSLARRVALAACGAVRKSLRLEQPPYHLWEFTPRTLSLLLSACGFDVERLRQSKVPPSMRRPGKTPFQRAAMYALDAVNLPLTEGLNWLGDRVTVVAKRTAVLATAPEAAPSPKIAMGLTPVSERRRAAGP